MSSIELVKKAEELANRMQRNDRCILTPKTKLQHIQMVVDMVKGLNIKGDEIIIVAYLHDILDYVEEPSKPSLIEEIRITFGSHILKLVQEVSDNFKMEDVSLSEKQFKDRMTVITSPGGISDTAAIIILAEKVCNLTDMYEEIKKRGDEAYWDDLHQKNGLKKVDVHNYYFTIFENIAKRCETNYHLRGLINRYDDFIYRIFEEN